MSFENKQFMNPDKKNQEKQQEDEKSKAESNKTILERIRDDSGLTRSVMSIAIFFTVSKGIEKMEEYDIAQEEEYIQDKIEQINEFEATNEEKLEKLEKWFGDHFKIGLEEYKENLQKAESYLEKDRNVDAEAILGDYEFEHDSTEVGSIRATSLEGDTLYIDYSGMKDIMYETFPENWVHNEIESITQQQTQNSLDNSLDKYGLDEEWEEVASFTKPEFKNQRGHINFTDYSISLDFNNIFNTMAHEFAHANDWESDNEMTWQDRLDLLFSVASRLDDPDRFYSEYVENIENEDRQKERYLKALEYWADITAEYFTNPDNLHIKDYKLVDDVVKDHEKNFDVKEAYLERADFIWENQHKIKE